LPLCAHDPGSQEPAAALDPLKTLVGLELGSTALADRQVVEAAVELVAEADGGGLSQALVAFEDPGALNLNVSGGNGSSNATSTTSTMRNGSPSRMDAQRNTTPRSRSTSRSW
jgi:hypothetical protein